MKKIKRIIAMALCACAILSFASCANYKGGIEQIDVTLSANNTTHSFGAIYRARIKEMQLYDTDFSNYDQISTTREFRYTYFTSEPIFKEVDYIWDYDTMSRYFSLPGADSYLRDTYRVNGVRIVIDRVDKVYRPAYTRKNGMITVEYYTTFLFNGTQFLTDSTLSGMCFKEERDYAAMRKALREFGNNKELNSSAQYIKEKYGYTAWIFHDKDTINADNATIAVSYHM